MDKNEIATPYFRINTDYIENEIACFKNQLTKLWPAGIIGYSFKTNNLPWIISFMKAKGLRAEVVSSDEYNLAKLLGYHPSEIIFNGPVKRKKEFIDAIVNGAIVNIDSKRELEWLLECDSKKLACASIGLRVNFCIEKICPGESQSGQDDGRFGFSYEKGELEKAVLFLREHNIPLSGLHLHCSSKTRSLNIYRAIAEIAAKITEELQLDLEYVDVGGGYFGGMPGKPSFKDYFTAIHSILSTCKRLAKTNIIVEPGISLIGAGVDYVTSVVDIKDTQNNCFIVLDGSRTHIDPLMHKKSYTYEIHRKFTDASKNIKKQTLCGFTCMEGDRFFDIKDFQLMEGDQIVFRKVGAYTMGLSPQFIEFYPPVYSVIEGKLVLVREKVSADDFLKIMNA